MVGAIVSTNKLLGLSGVDGIKTGTLNSAGASLLFSSRFIISGRTIHIIGVILDGPDHPTIDRQIQTMIEAVRGGFHTMTLARAGQKFGSYETRWGATASILAAGSRSIVVWGATPATARIATDSISIGKKGSIVGSVTFVVGGQTLTVPLTLSHGIVDPGPWWPPHNPGELL